MSLYEANAVADVAAILKQILAPYIGTFENGRSAIVVEPPQVPPAGKGVHCYIQRYPRKISGELYRWEISLVLHGDDIEKIDGAISVIRQRFPRCFEAIPPYREGFLLQANFGLIFERFAYSNY